MLGEIFKQILSENGKADNKEIGDFLQRLDTAFYEKIMIIVIKKTTYTVRVFYNYDLLQTFKMRFTFNFHDEIIQRYISDSALRTKIVKGSHCLIFE